MGINVFEQAAKERYRFNFKGNISVEDLYLLPVEQLDTIFKGLNAELKTTAEESLLGKKTKVEQALINKIEIVKHIVSEKLAVVESKRVLKEKKEQEQKIMEILSARKDKSLENKTDEELMAMLQGISGTDTITE